MKRGMHMWEATGLRENLIKEIAALAAKYDLHRVVLFGSRARGDYGERSDIDLAVCGGNIAEFSVDVEEETDTLLFFDVVNLDGAVTRELREEINREGVVLYEKI